MKRWNVIQVRSLAPALLLLAFAVPAAAQSSGATPQAQASFSPDALRLDVGFRATVTLQVEPPQAQVWIDGPDQADVQWYRSGDQLRLTARHPGAYTLRARLGQGGPTLATLDVTVDAGLLDRVLARVRETVQQGQRPVVVFDLDDTLFDTRWRMLTLLQRWGSAHDEPRLSDLQVDDMHYDLNETLHDAGLSNSEIYGSLGRAVSNYYWQHFSSYELDHAFPGAVEFVQAVQDAGALVAYVTARSSSKRAASQEELRRLGFPLQDTRLYLRYASSQDIPAYKGSMVRYVVSRYGTVVACFENEARNANAFLWGAPHALQGFLDTQQSADQPALLSGVETIEGWQ